ncbi:MAG: integrin alpha [Planctomycetes bacterium]|nr:integrin alpha [Planctomycetota bacterium]
MAAFLAFGTAGTAFGQAYTTESFLGPAGSYFGWSVAGLGDLTGNGSPEVAVGAPFAAPVAGYPAAGAGQVRVIAGGTGALLYLINGTTLNDRFGASVASIGDVNADGVPDFVVGATQNATVMPCYCAPGPPMQGIFGPGYARVFSGATGVAIYTVTGTAPGDFFGESVAGTGDLDGDAIPDFVVGAPQKTTWNAGIGYVRTVSGLTGTTLLTIPGAPPCLQFGASVAGTGDVDGDGFGDLIVGTSVVGSGCARVLSGASGVPLATFTPASPNDGLGASVAGPGDLDGDGAPDFFVGAPNWSPPGLDYAGRARAISGASGNVLFDLVGSAPYRHIGRRVASAGDMDGDAIPDIGASGDGEIAAASGSDGASIFVLAEVAFSLAGAGDRDGDGLDDVVSGFPTPYGGGYATWGGTARIISMTGVPGGSYLFGAGCTGSSGLVPGIGAMGGAPDVGNGNAAFGIRLFRARAIAPAILIAGASSQAWGGLPLPFDLGPAGIPGCSLLVAPEALISTATSATGLAEIQIPVPPSPALTGGAVFLQWYVADPGPLLLPGAMSRGLQLLLL